MKVGSENFCSHFIIILMYLLCLPDQRASFPFPRSSFSLSFSPLPLIFSYLFAFHDTQWRRQRAVLILFGLTTSLSIDPSIYLSVYRPPVELFNALKVQKIELLWASCLIYARRRLADNFISELRD